LSRKHPLPSVEFIRRALLVTNDGTCIWKERPRADFSCTQSWRAWNRQYCGKIAGTTDQRGYGAIQIGGCNLPTHRIVWTLTYGEWPERDIDHLNGITTDNRPENLRDVHHSVNHRNRRKNPRNTSGRCGVSWRADKGKWRAFIATAPNKPTHLGYFESFEAAVHVREAAELNLGYTARHGKVA
jgi:hypothetical protein